MVGLHPRPTYEIETRLVSRLADLLVLETVSMFAV